MRAKQIPMRVQMRARAVACTQDGRFEAKYWINLIGFRILRDLKVPGAAQLHL
jgi:hypothetical protein